ncbi:hypothetical protein IW261DRAFT_1424735 [Armillaria novae-zelandiae]|uniref:Uncharacterized protein n=1 Tax=Armillaria novae-zelandiae TaxID=153914 RepID=A0AA39NU54_9AGAR|nr:hypothetical protein IW261DRAFT_1424735 [Armillaria novae-zelandiae]
MSKPFDGAALDDHVNITSLSPACERFYIRYALFPSPASGCHGRINVKDVFNHSRPSPTPPKSRYGSAPAYTPLLPLFLSSAFKAKVKLVDAFNVITGRLVRKEYDDEMSTAKVPRCSNYVSYKLHGYIQELRRKSPSINYVSVKPQNMSASAPDAPA